MPPKVEIEFEDTIQLPIEKTYELALKWLEGQHKAKILKKTNPPNYIEAKQGTMNTSSGFDPQWKKRLWINLFDKDGIATLVKVRAMPLSRNIRTSHIPKLKDAWWNGLISRLYSLLVEMEGSPKQATSQTIPFINPKEESGVKTIYCSSCGKKVDKDAIICPFCGKDIIGIL